MKMHIKIKKEISYGSWFRMEISLSGWAASPGSFCQIEIYCSDKLPNF